MLSGQLIVIQKPSDVKGESTIQNFSVESFAEMITGAGAELIEKMLQKDVKISGDMAVVSRRYTFYIGKNLSYCGTNTFNLVCTKTRWKVAMPLRPSNQQIAREI